MPSSNFPWVKKPLLASAPMSMSAGPALAVAVSRAGGLGFIGPAMDASGTGKNLSTFAKAIREFESLYPPTLQSLDPTSQSRLSSLER
ncbi:uncharacterized protein ACHE_60584S [Aspergillus chevalieri]|uniref:Nitronate monooxygenase domain-containing protein n=1 Tax=Aspergillus chevalieri TaxID=182096 RepID=A0A7R7VV13_ASPCH|nr:uncharacterized protein ACHE_60584S [Aspergillus chevalieri]BCR90698.1 hypothetical protein ACHE_60584S [Aspergillus chevalieri]